MWILKPFIIILLFYLGDILSIKSKISDTSIYNSFKADSSIKELTEKYGYQCENHWIITEDGYVLVMHRIRTSIYDRKAKPAVLIMHGLTGSSTEWVTTGPGNALGFDLVDAGYDVWLGNNRGNSFSRYHVKLDPDVDDEFWDFSFEDCGYYDLPAKIDYILKTTGQQKIFYVGLSQGTSQFFAMAALRPEYNDKVALMSALAPIAYMTHTSSPVIKIAVRYLEPLKKLMTKYHVNEVFGYNSIVSKISQIVCSNDSVAQEICVLPRFLLFGFDTQQLDRSTLALKLSHSPAGTSSKSLFHYGQLLLSGYFRRFDYGIEQNRERYNVDTPPNYNLSAISVPIALYYGQNDLLAAVEDVDRLARELPNVVKNKRIDYKRWTHLDFNCAKDVHELLNVDLIAHQQEFIDDGALTTTTTAATPRNGGNRMKQGFGFTLIFFLTWLMN